MGRFVRSLADRADAAPLSELQAQIVANVATHGWHCAIGEPTETRPGYACSVGFWEAFEDRAHPGLPAFPEFVVFGLPTEMAQLVLWQAFCQVRDLGAEPAEGMRWPNLIQSFDSISRPVDRTWLVADCFADALWYRRHRAGAVGAPLSMMQLFWPSRLDGLYPWEEGCAESARLAQPPLYLPPA